MKGWSTLVGNVTIRQLQRVILPNTKEATSMDLPGADESNDLFLHIESDSEEDVDILGAK